MGVLNGNVLHITLNILCEYVIAEYSINFYGPATTTKTTRTGTSINNLATKSVITLFWMTERATTTMAIHMPLLTHPRNEMVPLVCLVMIET